MKSYEARTEVLQGLYDKNGHLTASMVLKSAKKVTSPIHDQFEWDDSAAAHEYRLDQSRHMIRSVTIVRADRTEKLINIPAIIREGRASEGVYQMPHIIVKTQSDFDRAKGAALSELAAAHRNLDVLMRAAGTKSPDIGAAVKHIAHARKRIEAARASE